MAALRLADLLAGLSRLADFGFGLRIGTGLRSCTLAARFGRELDLPAADARAAFYTALLHHVGCVGFAHETARLFGDEIVTNTAAGRTDSGSPGDLLTTFLPTLMRDRSPRERTRLALVALTRGASWGAAFTSTACEVGRESARRLQLPPEVEASLFHVYDVWGGRSARGGLRGDDIPVGARIARLTGIAVLFHSMGGADLAVDAVRRRAGGMLDPDLAGRFAVHARDWLNDLDRMDGLDAALESEPRPHLTAPDLLGVARLFGDLADLKSPYLAGHSRAVAALAAGAARQLGLPPGLRVDLEIAGLLHDTGRVAVSNRIWDKPGPLSTDEWEQVRLHPYYSERVLAGSVELDRLGPLVGRHHERLDGTGYHRGSTAADLSLPARILAVADAFRTMTEQRPHRPALAPDMARRRLLAAVHDGRLDDEAAQAVLATASGGTMPPSVTSAMPRGLTDREVEVLGLVARGCSNREIARRLVISRRTAEHHVQHIYAKVGVSSRAAATLFAVEHGLLPRDG